MHVAQQLSLKLCCCTCTLAATAAAVHEQEVGETFLRCVKERFAETNAVIELNGLKIAEDRTFADCARYIFTAMLQVSTGIQALQL
jgi:hypothetical protein